ncbi:Putative Zn-dependent protease, contains TPR repeats [Sphingomonas laterariae]|uniref:Putative Zn-dependent protease, contains TPR repeats n=1 Tax=Edaphosphingomonas laterariae TaxID=861865 RepID=A0A239F272_9SPHN|nr:M48 family metalloprotease [Sphingomonas laterariae]SNS50917.1 Putative Zn-dependent protease, contains TPR repeats [Sphingomonas laterariae]
MRRTLRLIPATAAACARWLVALLLSLSLLVQPAMAQSILRDAETEALLNDLARPIVIAAGLEPGNVQMVLIQDPEINAFVAGGQIVYIHSGLITAADNANEVQGVIAHEVGHITGGHIVRFSEGASAANGISMLSLLLGAAAIAMGAGEAGMGILSAGQQAAMSKFLAFTRTQESSADAAGASFMKKAGVSGKGSVSFFQKLRKEEFRLSSSYADVDPYARTHPMSADRAAVMENELKSDPAWSRPTDPTLEARFQRVKGKLAGFVNEPKVTLAKYPESNRSVPAHYARAYAWHKAAYPDKAVAEIDSLVAGAPHDPYFLELKGQVLLESGRPADAIPPLREAVAATRGNPLIASLLGHALIATENPANRAEARTVLRNAVARDNDNPFAWYQLGIVYSQEGDIARAALATAERYSMIGQPQLALSNAETAMRGIPQGTPDYVRAEDIALTSRQAMEDRKRKR